GTQLGGHLVTGPLRHHHIEDGQRGTTCPRRGDRSVSVDDAHHLVASALEPQRHEREDVLVVVRAENQLTLVAHVMVGSSTMKVVPCPSLLCTPMRPPWASTIAFEM